VTKPKSEIKSSSKSKREDPEDLKNYPTDKLNEMLSVAIDKEDYEQAAKIRDELSKRN